LGFAGTPLASPETILAARGPALVILAFVIGRVGDGNEEHERVVWVVIGILLA